MIAAYFPTLQHQFAAMKDALFRYTKWLEIQWTSQHMDIDRWRAEFRPEDLRPLEDVYVEEVVRMTETVVRRVPRSRQLARALARQQ